MRLIFLHKEDSQQNQWVEKDLDRCPGSLWRSSVRKGGMQQVVVATIQVLAPCHPQARLIDQVQSLLTAIVQSACQLFCQRNVCSHNWNQVKVTVCTQMHGLVSFANHKSVLKTWTVLSFLVLGKSWNRFAILLRQWSKVYIFYAALGHLFWWWRRS